MEDYREIKDRSRERAIWPDEVPPEEEPFVRYDDVFKADSPNESEPQIEPDIQTQPLEPEHEEVWLDGPPPDDFGHFASPVIVRNSPAEQPFEPEFVPVAYVPEVPAETVRRSGLAYSAGIVFFASVAFMLLLGWGADLLFGSSPWGLVGGVLLGSIIGFIQFFRIASRIYPAEAAAPPTLLSVENTEERQPPF